MKVLVNPKITLNKGIKGKCREYSVVLHKNNTNELTIRSISPDGKDKRVAGTINREGKINYSNKHSKFVKPLITDDIKSKIELLLDLVFGKKRDKFPEINAEGYTEFKK